MTDPDKCIHQHAQGCTITAGKCPCRHYSEDNKLEEFKRAHWSFNLVRCKDCKHYSGKDGECPMKSVYYIQAKYPDLGDRILFDHTTPDGWCYKGVMKE